MNASSSLISGPRSPRAHTTLAALSFAIVLSWIVLPAHAQTFIGDAAGNGLWSEAASWQSGTIPSPSISTEIALATNNGNFSQIEQNIRGAFDLHRLSFGPVWPGTPLSGGALRLNEFASVAPVIVVEGNASPTIHLDIHAVGSAFIHLIGAGQGNLTLTGKLSGRGFLHNREGRTVSIEDFSLPHEIDFLSNIAGTVAIENSELALLETVVGGANFAAPPLLDATESTFNAGDLFVGQNGAGGIRFWQNSQLSAGTVRLGDGSGALGTLTLGQAGVLVPPDLASAALTGDLRMGQNGGKGVLEILRQAQMTVGGTLLIEGNDSEIAIEGGRLSVNRFQQNSGGGTIVLSPHPDTQPVLQIAGNAASDIRSSISGTGGVSVSGGGGSLRLHGTNTYSGGTRVTNNATLFVADASDLGASSGDLSLLSNGFVEAVQNVNFTGRSLVLGPNHPALPGGTFRAPAGVTIDWRGPVSGDRNFIHTGAGSRRLFAPAGPNAGFTGNLVVQQGTTEFKEDANAFPNAALELTGGSVHLSGVDQVFTSLIGSSGGTLRLQDADLVVNQTGNTFFSSAINMDGTTNPGKGRIVKQGIGMLTLNGPDQDHRGYTVAGGTLRNLSGAQLGENGATLFLSGGTYRVDSGTNTQNRDVNLGSFSGIIHTDSLSSVEFADGLNNTTSSASLTKSGSGILTFSGNSAFSGTLNVSAGQVRFAGAGMATEEARFLLSTNQFNDAILCFDGDQTVAQISGGFSSGSSSHGTLNLANNSQVIIRLDGPSSSTYNGRITGSGTLVKAGSGTLNVRNFQTSFGGWLLDDGVLSFLGGCLGDSVVFRGGTLRLLSSSNTPWTVGAAGGTVDLPSGNFSQTAPIHGSGTLTQTNLRTLTIDTTGSTFDGQYVLSGGTLRFEQAQSFDGSVTIVVDGTLNLNGTSQEFARVEGNGSVLFLGGSLEVNAGQDHDFNGNFNGDGTLVKTGAATFNLGGNAFIGTRLLSMEEGAIRLTSDTSVHDGTAVHLDAPGTTFDVNGHTATIGALSGSGTVLLGASGELRLRQSSATTWSGDLSGGASSHFIKTGPAPLTYAGSATFGGRFSAEDGLLEIAGELHAASLTIEENAILGGDGDIFPSVNVAGHVAPGSSAGTLTFKDDLTLESTATLVVEIGGLTPGDDFDQVKVDGAFTAGGVLQVELIDNFSPQVGASFKIIDAGTIMGTFSDIDFSGATLAIARGWNTDDLYTDGILRVTTAPATYHVDANATGANDGTSWEDAFTEVKAALHVAQAGDEIRVAAGVYRTDYNPVNQTYTQNRTDSIVLKTGVALYGGYQLRESEGGLGAIRDPNPLTNNTVLDAFFGTDPNNNAHRARRVVHGTLVHDAILDGFTIRGGRGDDSSPAAGALITGDDVTIRNCRFTDNHVDTDVPPHPSGAGGGLRISSGNSLLENVQFDNNRANRGGGLSVVGASTFVELRDCVFLENYARQGGGISIESGAVAVKDSLFHDNEAQGDLFSTTRGGGAIAQWGVSQLDVVRCHFEENESKLDSGGAISSSSPFASTLVRDSVFVRNETSFSGGSGGAIGASGPLDVASSRFTRNRAVVNGGAVSSFHAATRIFNSEFEGNVADASGGGVNIRLTNSPEVFPGPILANCVFSGNRANRTVTSGGGGGVHVGGGPGDPDAVTIVNCTFASNVAENGGGIRFAGASTGSSHSIQNSIFWNNEAAQGNTERKQIEIVAGSDGPNVTVEYTIVQGLSALAGNNNTSADPLFFSAPSPGPDATWGTADDDYGNLRPGLFSPALDSGQAAALPQDWLDLNDDGDANEAVPLDLAGRARRSVAIGVTPTGTGGPPFVDRGAYEMGGAVFVDKTATGNADGSSWENAFVHIQHALAAGTHAQVLVAEGVYRVFFESDSGMPVPIQVNNPVAIFGGYPSGGGSEAQRAPFIHETVVDGELVPEGAKARHVFFVQPTGSLELDGLVVRNGGAAGLAAPGNRGGGIHALGPLVLRDVWVKDSVANADGGGIYLAAGGEFTRVHISGCAAENNGGGLYHQSMQPALVQESSFVNNSANRGGGVFIQDGEADALPPIEIYNSTFSGNSAETGGGGLAVFDRSASLFHCTLNENTAGGSGGGLFVSGLAGSIELRSTIAGVNQAPTGPELFAQSGGSFTSKGYNLVRTGDGASIVPATGDLLGSGGTLYFPELDVLTTEPGIFTWFHPLDSESPCLDAGGPVSFRPTDQRGMPREINGAVDIGAWEWVAPRFLAHPSGGSTVLGQPFTLSFSAVGDDTIEWFKGHPVGGTIPTDTWTLIATGDNPLEHIFIEPTQTVWVRIANAYAQTISEGAEVEISGTPADFWRWQFFGTTVMLNPGLEDTVWGWNADPNGNGILNRFEWHLGRDPLAPGYPPLFDRIAVEPVSGSTYYTLEFRRRFGYLVVDLEESTDLVNWQAVFPDGFDVIETVLDPDPLGDQSVEDVRLQFLMDNEPRRFVRFAENPAPPEFYPFYMPNILNFPVGAQLSWTSFQDQYGRTLIPSGPVRVMRMLSIVSGLANLDVDGSGVPASGAQYAALGIDTAERERIAVLFVVNQTFLRAAIEDTWQPWQP